MATGDQTDIGSRIQQLIPHGWFTNGLSPIRDALLQGAASALAFAYSLLAYVRIQTRINTASDGFLDMIAADFFGSAVARSLNQSDASLRSRITINLFRERGTRNAVTRVLTQLTGRAPVVFEPARPADTGGYGMGGGYGVAATGYGSMLLPMQAFVTAYRPLGVGIPNVAGYGVPTAGYSTPSQGEYASLSMVQNAVTDADIYNAIDRVRPAGYTVWVAISS